MNKKCIECKIDLNKTNIYSSSLKEHNYICILCSNKRSKNSNYKIKINVFENYGNKCACCGENNIKFLTIDHINNDGAKHRKNENINTGNSTYRWIIKNNYPKNLQLLCWNCNCSKNSYGYCPHQISYEQHLKNKQKESELKIQILLEESLIYSI